MQILTTKLSIPPMRSRLVDRSRLIQKLDQGWECGFLLVSAPAGYGKSTLLSAWLSKTKVTSAWLSLDENDNDLIRFLAYLGAALRSLDPVLGKSLEIGLQTSPLPSVETLLTPLVNDLAQLEQPFCLVLDDYHLIQERVVHQSVAFLLEHRPAPLHLIIATRSDPPLPLARLRARAGIVEIRLADLRFTHQEVADFLDHTMRVQISAEDVVRITARTEGWIAGLQIAALCMQHMEDVPGFIASLSGSNYYIFDYLLKEVLAQQSPETRRFLLYTSILDHLTAPLCDILMVGDGDAVLTSPSAVILEELEHANLFVIPLDQEHRWLRYHHLFSDLLRVTLEQVYPGRTIELHRRACRWYAAQGMLPAALEHAISSGDMQLVTQIVSENVLVLVENDEILPTLQKIDSLPPDAISVHPWFGIARAWFLGGRHIEQIHHMLDEAEKNAENIPDAIERQRLHGHIAAARAGAYNTQADIPNLIRCAQLANELLPSDEVAVRAMNLSLLGKTLSVYKHDPGAIPILEEALRLALKAKKPHVAMIAASQLATAHLFAGRIGALQQICLRALDIAEEYQPHTQRPFPATARIYPLLSRAYAEWGEHEQAIRLARKGLSLNERWGSAGAEALCLLYLGRALAFANDREQAKQVLQRHETAAQKISLQNWEEAAVFALDSLLDIDPPDAGEITWQRQRLQERDTPLPLPLKARLSLRDGQPEQALLELEQALVELKGRPSYDIVRIYALRALALQAKGDDQKALTMLKQALELGEPEKRIMTFVREGALMERLLRLAHAKGIAPPFVQRLQGAFASRRKTVPTSPIPNQTLVEPLSRRELEVLKLLAQGCADKQIAETLVISGETVHKHLKNIYGKLDVHSRTEAVARACELSLL